MKSGESEVHSEELPSKQIFKKEENVGERKSNLWSWVPICKAFLFPMVPDLHHNRRAELKVSQGSLGGHSKDTEAPAIEQSKAQEFRPENELPDLITAPIDEASKSPSISAEVDYEGGQQLTSIGFYTKVSSHAKTPNSHFKRKGIESTGSLSSVSSSPQRSLSSPAHSAFGRILPDFNRNAMASVAMQLPSPSFFSQLPPFTSHDHVSANTPDAINSQWPDIFQPPWSANWGDPIPSYNQILPVPSPAHQFTIPSPLPSPSGLGVPMSPNGLFSGILPERRSFNNEGMGPIPKHSKGACESGDSFNKTLCNRKLVGARVFEEGYAAMYGTLDEDKFHSVRDLEGHGTHTTSIAASRFVEGASMMGYARGIAKGIAPHARIVVYKVCWVSGCFDSDILSAIDEALEDGVDVISMSIAGQNNPYFVDSFAIATFEAVKWAVFISASAGNYGPDARSVANLAPWVTTVGAGTLDRDFPADVRLGNGTVLHGVSLYSGKGLNARRLVPLFYPQENNGSNSSSSLCNEGSLDPKIVSGKIVLCPPSQNSRADKGLAVKQAGGVGMINSNIDSDEGLLPSADLLPSIAVGSAEGDSIRQYILSTQYPTATIIFHGTKFGLKPAPVVASFSGRGPNFLSPEILKPDIIAPGLSILAAWTDSVGPTGLSNDSRKTEFNIISGTSMSCPHISGVAALLKGAHPDWSPAAIRSAIMTTAYTSDIVNKSLVPMGDEATGNASTPFDFGAGHVDPQRATDPGLIYDLGVNDYVNFLCNSNYTPASIELVTNMNVSCPAEKGHPGDLNYPSFSAVFNQSQSSNLSTSFSRTLTNVGPTISTYTATVTAPTGVEVTVEPQILKFSNGDEKLSFKLSVSAQPFKFPPEANSTIYVTVFGSLAWSDGKHVVRSPIAITRQF